MTHTVKKEFVHLHVHTEFSLLDGFSRIGRLVDRVAELGMGSVAITDHGAMYGVIDFYRAAKDAGVKPIIGMEAYLTKWGRTRFDKDSQIDTRPYHLLLLARNQTGYKNLLKIASASQLDGYYYRPRIDHDFLQQHSEGLIATSGCLAAEIPRMVEQGRDDEAKRMIGWYQDVFGADNFFLELQHHNIPELHALNRWLRENQNFANVPFLATNDVHYVLEEDYDNHDTLLCVQTGNVKAEQNRLRFESPTFHLRTQEEMWRLFAEVPESLTNTLLVAEMCDVNLDSDDYHLPVFPVPEGFNAETYLRYLCERGLEWRYGARANDPEVVNRLNHELKIIHEMGFDTYFLIVWDLCEFARHRDIWWNVRGSGAGSVAAYTLGITNIDPLRNNLIFERFLNPGRVSMPDIDLDYPEDRRAEMIQYCAEKYGEDKVAAIITFGTMGSKAALRDVGRALDMPLTEVDRIARLIPSGGKPVKFKDALGDDPDKALPDLKQAYARDANARRLIDEAWALEGITRHASTHAAGVIVADKPLVEYIPLHRPTKGSAEDAPVKMVTQFPMETCESIGLLKVDFLGLSTLTIMRRACEMIAHNHGIHYDLSNIPYRPDPDDPEQSRMVAEMFEMLGRGETIGVFQLESAGMRRMLTDMRPDRFEHVVAGISLYRPGPMEYIPQYNRRLHGEEEVEYKHPLLEPILEETYSIIVYQEQIMQIAAELFGYELGEADLMRRAVSKKKEKDLLKHKQIFIERGPERGVSPDVAEAIFADIEFFARYGFNKCLTKDTQIIDAETGRLVRIGDLVEGRATIEHTVTLDTNTLELQSGAVTQVMENGVKPVYTLTTQLGRTITATANHPFYTFDGWRLLGELQAGDQIAVPRRIPVEGSRAWPDSEIVVLADALDLSDPDAALPDAVFTLTNAQIADLLRRVWQRAADYDDVIRVVSSHLARQVQHLLLRLGVLCRVAQAGDEFEIALVTDARAERRGILQSAPTPSTLAWLSGVDTFKSRDSWEASVGEGLETLPGRVRTEGSMKPVPTDCAAALFLSPNVAGGESRPDITWDRVVSIEYAGEEMTYDLTVPGTHNFVANDIIVHNSHAADYAVLTCQTAFLKCHYPHEFMAALMSVHHDDSAKVGLFAADCHRMGIEILPPTVNNSELDFSIEEQADGTRAIRFGLGAIKNVGQGPLLHIIEQREQGGPFTDLDDFCRRVDARIVNRRALESLVKVGALDEFAPRPALLAALDRIIAFSVDHHKAQDVGQLSLFGEATGVSFGAEESILSQLYDVDPVPEREMLNWEKDLVGLYVTGHPLRDLWGTLQQAITHTIAELIEGGEDLQDQQVTVAGLVSGVRQITTKKGDAMAVITLEDVTAVLSAVLFPRTWANYEEWLDEELVVIVRGKADVSRGDMQVIVDSVTQNFELVTPGDELPLPQEVAFSWIDDDDPRDLPNGSDAPPEDARYPAPQGGEPVAGYDDAPDDPDEDLFAPDEDSPYDEETGEMKSAAAEDDAPTTNTEPVIPASQGAGVYTAPPIEPPSAPPPESPAPPPMDAPRLDDREMPAWLDDDFDSEIPVADWDPVRDLPSAQDRAPREEPPQRPAFDAAGRVLPPPAPADGLTRDSVRESARPPHTAREHERDSAPASGRDPRRPRRDRPSRTEQAPDHLPRRPRPQRDQAQHAPQHPPRMLTVTIRRSGDSASDRRRMRRLHGMLTQYPGQDHFRFVLVDEHRSAQLDFPNHLIAINDTALGYVARIVGEDNIAIEDL